METETIYCCKCGIKMEQKEVLFQYMGHHFKHELPKCPKCGRVHITEIMVQTKMKDTEVMLEEK